MNIARGYKAGGFNLGNFRPVLQVDPETLTDYEGGIKKTFGKTLLVDAAAYYYDYTNLQVPITVGTTVRNPVTNVSGIVYVGTLANSQKTRSVGFELESVYSPLDNLHLTIVYSYQNAEFRRFRPAVAGAVIRDNADGTNYTSLAGNTVPQVPENKISLIPQYVVRTGYGDLSLSALYTWTDSEYFAVFNTLRYRARSYYNLDLRAVFQPRNSHLTAIAYIRNVTDSTQFIYYGAGGVFPRTQTVYTLSEPRSFGAELQYRF